MRRSIYEILNKNIDFESEYVKLYKLFINDWPLKFKSSKYSWANMFDKFIEEWECRGTYKDIEEIMADLELEDELSQNDNIIEKLLLLIDLISNVKEFVLYKINDLEKKYKDDKNISRIYISSDMIKQNIDILLKELGYRQVRKEKYKLMLMKDKSDVISTALMVEDQSVADLIMSYNDFRIETNLEAKKDIIFNLGQYIEPLREIIEAKDEKLEDYIFFCLNKLHIRHNNKSGKKKNEYIAKMKKKDLIAWYDKLYDLILIAIRLIELPNVYKDFKDLKDMIITIKEEV